MHLVIQLNEASRDVMREIVASQVTKPLHALDVVPDGDLEHHGLDPWVNWLSFSLGRGLVGHQCYAHGSGVGFNGQFIWDNAPPTTRFGLVGVMNVGADLPRAPVDFFLGDPWTPDAPVQPSSLRSYRDAWGYLAKHYGSLSLLPTARALGSILQALLTTRWGRRSMAHGAAMLCAIGRVPMSALVFAFYDWTLVEIFMAQCRRHKIDRGVVFLNGIAHFQHSYWDSAAGNNFITRTYRAMMVRLLKGLDVQRLDILNGLEQQRSGQVFVWRQKDPAAFFRHFFPGLSRRVEQGMTNDTTLMFDSADDKARFDTELRRYTVLQQPLLHIEDAQDASVSVRVHITQAASGAWILRDGQPWVPFEDWFYVYRVRTGEHVKKCYWLSTEAYQMTNPSIAEVGRLILGVSSV